MCACACVCARVRACQLSHIKVELFSRRVAVAVDTSTARQRSPVRCVAWYDSTGTRVRRTLVHSNCVNVANFGCVATYLLPVSPPLSRTVSTFFCGAALSQLPNIHGQNSTLFSGTGKEKTGCSELPKRITVCCCCISRSRTLQYVTTPSNGCVTRTQIHTYPLTLEHLRTHACTYTRIQACTHLRGR